MEHTLMGIKLINVIKINKLQETIFIIQNCHTATRRHGYSKIIMTQK
jgi:hypothetical protein